MYAQVYPGGPRMMPSQPSARDMSRVPLSASPRSFSPRQSPEDQYLEAMRQDFFEYISEQYPESKKFMARYWSIACRFKTIMGKDKEPAKDMIGLFKNKIIGNRSEDEVKAELIDDFMVECERWQNRFRKVVVDGNETLKVIEDWTAHAEQRFAGWRASDGRSMVALAIQVDATNSARASTVHHWVKELYLRRMHAYWFLMNPKRVHNVILFLGAESLRFMKCLSVNISAGHLIAFEGLFNRVMNRRYQFKGRDVAVCEAMFDAISKESDERDGDVEGEVWDLLAPKKPDESRNPFERFCLPTPQKVEIEFYWCGVKGLLTHEKIQIISALSVCDETSGVFKPVVSRALFHHHWLHCFTLFCLDRALDTVSLCCLLYVVYQSKLPTVACPVPAGVEAPNGCAASGGAVMHETSISVMMWVVAGINVFMLVQIVFEAGMAACQRNRCWATAYNLFLVGMELVTLLVLWQLCGIISSGGLDSLLEGFGLAEQVHLNESASELAGIGGMNSATPSDEFTYLLAHKPIMFCALILFKWMQFLLGFLVFDIGKTVLPAVYAMKSPESMKFVIYMTMVIFACTHAYWSLPLEAGDYEIAGNFGSAATSLFRMFRLCVMGDFDIWELEGIDGVKDGDGYVDEDPSDWTAVANSTGGEVLGKALYFHQDLRTLTMGVGVVVTIMLMNMYIGVLSIAYEQYLAIKLEVFSHAKSKFMIRYLLRRHAFRNFTKLRCFQHQHTNDEMTEAQMIHEENAVVHELEILFKNAKLTSQSEDHTPEIPEAPPAFKEHLLVGKNHWFGFWTTVPQDLVTPEGSSQTFQRMEDTQETLGEKLDVMDGNLDAIEDMLDRMLETR